MTKAKEWKALKESVDIDELSIKDIYTQGWLDGIRFIQSNNKLKKND